MAGAKKFSPSKRKLQKARESGDVAKSRMLTSAGAIIACNICLFYSISRLNELSRFSIQCLGAAEDFHTNTMLVSGLGVGRLLVSFLLPPIAVSALMVLLVEFLQVGFFFSWKALNFRWSRIDIVSGLKRILGIPASEKEGATLGALADFGKLLGGALVLSAVWGLSFRWGFFQLSATAIDEPAGFWRACQWLMQQTQWPVMLAGVLLGVMGFFSARKKRMDRLGMDFQELKNEMRETEGSPETRSARKQLHQELSLHSVVEGVRKAQVVVVNREQ